MVQNLPAYVFDLVCEILVEFEDLLNLARVNSEIRGFVHDRLRVLRVDCCENLTSLHLLTSFTALTSLRELRLFDCASLTDVRALASCTALTLLDLNSCDSLTDVSALASCTALTSLNLYYCPRLTDVSALASCTALTSLNLRSCSSLTARGVSALANSRASCIKIDIERTLWARLWQHHEPIPQNVILEG